jgi:hypothetical protein
MVGEASTITNITTEVATNIRSLCEEGEEVGVKWVSLFTGQFNTRFMKKKSALSTSVKRREYRMHTPITFFLVDKKLINKL